ncbi:hypothetical protein B484DRAFT_68493 [Ochromonadaceae sp. CCMP2298]|nr:hypothetical protein B484DRAFT_68493 [Ochromonadaceae sp. CCMP2298]
MLSLRAVLCAGLLALSTSLLLPNCWKRCHTAQRIDNNPRFRGSPRRYTEGSEDIFPGVRKVKGKPKPENVDIFAAMERKAPVSAKSGGINLEEIEEMERKEEEQRDSRGGAHGASAVSRQAEMLRLEAFRDQMEFEYERIERQMVSAPHLSCNSLCHLSRYCCSCCCSLYFYPHPCITHSQLLLASIDSLLLRLLAGTCTVVEAVQLHAPIMSIELFLRLVELTIAEPSVAGKQNLRTLYDNLMDELSVHADVTDVTGAIDKLLKAENRKLQQRLRKNDMRLAAEDLMHLFDFDGADGGAGGAGDAGDAGDVGLTGDRGDTWDTVGGDGVQGLYPF